MFLYLRKMATRCQFLGDDELVASFVLVSGIAQFLTGKLTHANRQVCMGEFEDDHRKVNDCILRKTNVFSL